MPPAPIPPSDSDTPVPRPGRFLALFAGFFVLLLAGNLLLSALNIGRPTAHAASVCANIAERVALGRAMAHPKLVLIGGSSVRRGFSAAAIARHFSVPVLNFGLLAEMGPELTLAEARKVLRPGDTALLSLEYHQYKVDRWNPIALDVMFACQTDHFSGLPLREKFAALMAVSPLRLWNIIRYARNRKPLQDEGGNIAEAEARAHGDVPLTQTAFPPLSAATRARVAAYGPVSVEILQDARGTAAIAAFVRWAQANHIKVAMTWPNTIGFTAYRTMPGFGDIAAFYRKLGVTVIGDPGLGFYPAPLFYDTQYHLAPEGIARRTRDFIAVMDRHRDLLPGDFGRAKVAKP